MKQEEIIDKLTAGEISPEDAKKLLAEEAEKKKKPLTCKVSEKGGLSVYGLQRMPVTLYVEQWERLLNFSDNIKAFIAENTDRLKRKE